MQCFHGKQLGISCHKQASLDQPAQCGDSAQQNHEITSPGTVICKGDFGTGLIGAETQNTEQTCSDPNYWERDNAQGHKRTLLRHKTEVVEITRH